jgi:hypothetical protein
VTGEPPREGVHEGAGLYRHDRPEREGSRPAWRLAGYEGLVSGADVEDLVALDAFALGDPYTDEKVLARSSTPRASPFGNHTAAAKAIVMKANEAPRRRTAPAHERAGVQAASARP